MSTLETMHQTAAKYYEEKNLDKALEIYLQIIQLNPADEVALSCVEDIYLEKDDKFNYYLSRANVNIAQNKLEYAINDTKKALALDIDNLDARRKLARLYKVSKQNLKAIDEFLHLVHLNAKDLDAYFELVDLYMVEGALESAITIAKQCLENFSDNKNVKNMLAQLYFKANDFDNALSVVEDKMLKTKILLQKGDNTEAKTILDEFKVENLDELQKKNYYVLLAQYQYNQNDFENSLNSIDEYVKISGPDAVSFQMKALIFEEKDDMFNSYLNWGFCKKLQGKTDEAIVEFNNADRINPKDKTVLIELAKLYAQVKEKYVSMEFWQRAYDIDGDEEAKNILAEFYYSEGDFNKAQEYGKTVEEKTKEEPKEEYTGLIDKIYGLFLKK